MILMDTTPVNADVEQTTQILVVEDERIIALNLKESLESLGYTVVGIAASGKKAVEKAAELYPDLVLMDIRLKGSMDGIQAAEQIWQRLTIPVIYVTGHSDRSTLERAKVTAPFGYILKPIKERELAIAIETALRRYEREQLLTAILKGMGDGVLVTDAHSQIKFLNQVAETLTGWQQDEARERTVGEVLKIVDEQTQQPVDDPTAEVLQKDTTIYRSEHLLLIDKNGKAIPVTNSVAPIKDSRGEPAGVVWVFRDISDTVAATTQRKRVEEAIRQQLEHERKLNQLQTQFIRTVSHEYRTPLAVISACSQLLENNALPQDKDKQLRNCKRIQAAVKYMVGLLENVLYFNQAESGKVTFNPVPLELNSFCTQLVEECLLLTSDGHRIQVLGCEPGCTIGADENLLQQILSNLLSNGMKYSSPGSEIGLKISCKRDRVIFQVCDRGIGIPLDDQSRIFDPFHRAANVGTIRGTGMGLAIVKRAVDLHGGTIAVESEVGVGTTVTVTLPGGLA